MKVNRSPHDGTENETPDRGNADGGVQASAAILTMFSLNTAKLSAGTGCDESQRQQSRPLLCRSRRLIPEALYHLC